MAVLNISFTIEQKCQDKVWSFVDTTPTLSGPNNGYGGSITGKAGVAISSSRADIKVTKLVMKDLKTNTTYDFSTGFLPTTLNKPDEISSTEMLSTLTRIEDGAYEIKYEVYGGDLTGVQADKDGVKYIAYNCDSVGTTSPTNYVQVTDVHGVITKYLNNQSFVRASGDTIARAGAAKIGALLDDASVNKLYYCNAKECIRKEMLRFRSKCKHDQELLKNISTLDTELLGAIIAFEKTDLTTVNNSLRDIEIICNVLDNKCNC